MRYSVFNFVSFAKPKTFEKKSGDGQDLASEAHPPPSTHQPTQYARQDNRRYQARDALPGARQGNRRYQARDAHPGHVGVAYRATSATMAHEKRQLRTSWKNKYTISNMFYFLIEYLRGKYPGKLNKIM